MNYEPAALDEESLSKIHEYEQYLSHEAGYPVILVAFSDSDQAPSQ
ncbi:hypothetical protein [Paenibacillus sp.]|jgi:hypothetical protein|nr:hypothetical protein [Paenibacillus sp.]MDR0270303.1 hypothetical protein [Paenibacillus sp.]